MTSKKPTLLVLIGAILIAWLLLSSIHPIQPIVNAGGAPPAQTSHNTQQSGGGGSLGNFSLFRLPSLNFSLPNLFNIKLPIFNLKLPSFNFSFNFKWPTFNWPNFGFGSGSGSGQASGSGSGLGKGGSGSGGSGGITGQGGNSAGSGQSQTTAQRQQPIFIIPRDLLLAIIVVVLIIAGSLLILRSRNAITSRMKKNSQESVMEQVEPQITALEDISKDAVPFTIDFEPDEKIVEYAGWGAQGGFLKPEIDQSLPLIWGFEPLRLTAPNGSTVYLGKDKLVEMSANPIGNNLIGTVSFTQPNNVVHASFDGESDLKWIRAVYYDEDVMKHFRLNFLLSSEEEKQLGVMTPREIVRKIIREKPELVKDKAGLLTLARIFERAFYGKKKISREEYELFLQNLAKSLTSAKVIICGPKNTS
jgi:hypothetical protein